MCACFVLAILEFEKKPVDAVALVGHKIQIPCLVKSNSQQSQDVTIVWERTEGASVSIHFSSQKLFLGAPS